MLPILILYPEYQGRIQDFKLGGAHLKNAPLKLEKNMFFCRKIVIFHTKYPKIFRASLRNCKNYDFLAENSDFSHVIPLKCSRLPLLGAIFLSAPPLTWNPGSVPDTLEVFTITEGGAKNFGVFRVKNHDFTTKKHIFFQF
jgi:hypothetical protein